MGDSKCGGRQASPASANVGHEGDGTHTEGNLEAANAVNAYYVLKVLKIRTGRGVQNTSQNAATTSGEGDKGRKNTFAFGFARAGRIAKIFSGLKTTSALGTDGIPVSVLEMGSDMLAGPQVIVGGKGKPPHLHRQRQRCGGQARGHL
jgi:hypothetical protein